jgi:hypothetical protein
MIGYNASLIGTYGRGGWGSIETIPLGLLGWSHSSTAGVPAYGTTGMVLKSVDQVRLEAASDPPTGHRLGERDTTEQLFGVVTEPFSAGSTCKQVDKDRHALLVEVRT